MVRRQPIKKSVRFAVLSHAGFKCAYCGAAPPDVLLHVDHIVPVAKGGSNDIANLTAACVACNIGKGVASVEWSVQAAAVPAAGIAPRIEFFWNRDMVGDRYVMISARCVEWPAADADPDGFEFHDSEYRQLCDASPRYSTHGWSSRGFSPYEAALYVHDLLSGDWAGTAAYFAFLDDLITLGAAGLIPEYAAPMVKRSLHPEVIHSRCRPSRGDDYEALADGLSRQASAAFQRFLRREHTEKQGR